jgi:hypothetical protein
VNEAGLKGLDQAARHVLDVASREAVRQQTAIGTEDLLVALASADTTTARLIADAGANPMELRRVIGVLRPGLSRPRDPDTLLATLGIDLGEIRSQAERLFGADAVARAAARARRGHSYRRLRTWISCNAPLAGRIFESPLAGQLPQPIPRVTRLVRRATRAARPRKATPGHLLLSLLRGKEPACEILDALGVDVDALVTATQRSISENEAPGKRAS